MSYQTFGPGFAAVYMRGVASGGDGNHSGSLPSVGIYLDEQPITTIQGALDVHLYDIARVEALAGPQGTLYGASSQAGTIRIITNKPDPTGFKAGYDLEGNTVDHGDHGLPRRRLRQPADQRASRRCASSAGRRHDAGYIDNVLAPAHVSDVVGIAGRQRGRSSRTTTTTSTRTGGRARAEGRPERQLDDHAAVMAQKQKANGSFGSTTRPWAS